MNPLLILAAAAAAFWLGQEYMRRKAAGTLPWGEPGPLALPPADTEVPLSPEGAAHLAAWGAIGWGADIFPASASRQQLPPPPPDGISVAIDCSAIAVGHGVWDQLATIASEGYVAGQGNQQIAARMVRTLGDDFARCQSARAPAAGMLVNEILRRVQLGRYVQLSYLGGAPQGGIMPNRSRSRTIGEALLMRAITGRRWPP